jgi:hypothetical protein
MAGPGRPKRTSGRPIRFRRESIREEGMLLVVAFALVLLSVPLGGGRLSALAQLELSAVWLLPAALTVQVLIISVFPHESSWVLPAAHVFSYGIILVFLVANRAHTGLRMVGLGVAMNAAAIAVNGGVMPASDFALALAGRSGATGEFMNSAFVGDAKLAFLGDIFAWPDPLPLHNVFSPGDVCILVGAAILLHQVCDSLLFNTREPRRRRLLPIKPL